MPLAHPPLNLQPALVALESISNIPPTPMPLAHPPPDLQPAFLALEPTSAILSTPMPLAHPPPNLQPILLALETTSTLLSTPLPNAHPPLNLQPALLALEPTLNYPTHTLASCSSRNLIYFLTCNQINFSMSKELKNMSSNIHYILTLPLAIHIESYQLLFIPCWYGGVLHNPPPITNQITSRYLELSNKFFPSSRHSPGG